MYQHYRGPRYCNVSVDYVVLRRGMKSTIDNDGDRTVYSLGTLGKLRSAPILCPSKVLYEILRRKYDIIHMHHPNPGMQLLYEVLRRRNPHARRVLSWHSDISRQRILKKLYEPFQNRMINTADRIIVASSNYRDSSTDLKGVHHKCTVLPYGFSRAVERPTLGEGKKILAVGRLVYYKGFEYLVRAMADASMAECRLTIIGEGPERNKLQQLIQTHHLSNRVAIIDHVSDDELAEYYKACDVFVLPSVDRAEAFGLVMLEVMAYGKPVVTTRLGTATDFIVKDGVNGRVVKPRSPECLRSAIREIVENKEKIKQMGEASLERLDSLFNVDKHFDKLHEVYESVLVLN